MAGLSSRKNRLILAGRWMKMPLMKPHLGASSQKKRLVFAGRCPKDGRDGRQSPGNYRQPQKIQHNPCNSQNHWINLSSLTENAQRKRHEILSIATIPATMEST